MVPVHLSRRSKPAKIRVRTARAGTALYPTRPFPEFSSRLSPPPESESFSLRASASHRSHANRKQGSGGFELPASKSWNARRGRERRAEFQAGLPAGRPPACGFGKRPPDLQKPHALRCRQRRFPPAPGLRPAEASPALTALQAAGIEDFRHLEREFPSAEGGAPRPVIPSRPRRTRPESKPPKPPGREIRARQRARDCQFLKEDFQPEARNFRKLELPTAGRESPTAKSEPQAHR